MTTTPTTGSVADEMPIGLLAGSAGPPTRQRFRSSDIAVSGARHLVAECVAGWGIDIDIARDAQLVTSELVSNAIQHAHATFIDVEVVDLVDRVMVVVDHDGTPPPLTDRGALPHVASPQDVHGRGLTIVDAICADWGIECTEQGTRSWCAVAVDAGHRTPPPRVPATPHTVAYTELVSTSLRAAVTRSQLLLRLTEALTAARTPSAVADAVTAISAKALGTRFSGIAVVEAERARMRYLSLTPLPAATADTWASFPVAADVPVAAAIRLGRAYFHETRSAAVAEFPALDAELRTAEVAALAHLPLQVEDRALGTLSLAWDRGRVMSPDDRALMTTIAGYAALALHRAMLAELHLGALGAIQTAMLPAVIPDTGPVHVAAHYRPVGEREVLIGGDWYDAFTLPNGHVCLVVGDVAGHGIDAATVMGKLRHAAHAAALTGAAPDRVVTTVNTLLRYRRPDTIASMLYLDYDPASRRLLHTNAGHPPALQLHAQSGPALIGTRPGPMLGVSADPRYGTGSQVLEPDTAVALYTDGLVEHRDTDLDHDITALALAAASRWRHGCDVRGLADHLLHSRTRSEQTDDICLLVATHPSSAG